MFPAGRSQGGGKVSPRLTKGLSFPIKRDEFSRSIADTINPPNIDLLFFRLSRPDPDGLILDSRYNGGVRLGDESEGGYGFVGVYPISSSFRHSIHTATVNIIIPRLRDWLGPLREVFSAWAMLDHRISFYVENGCIRIQEFDRHKSKWKTVSLSRRVFPTH
jgi:hypothetical protein